MSCLLFYVRLGRAETGQEPVHAQMSSVSMCRGVQTIFWNLNNAIFSTKHQTQSRCVCARTGFVACLSDSVWQCRRKWCARKKQHILNFSGGTLADSSGVVCRSSHISQSWIGVEPHRSRNRWWFDFGARSCLSSSKFAINKPFFCIMSGVTMTVTLWASSVFSSSLSAMMLAIHLQTEQHKLLGICCCCVAPHAAS